MPAAQRCRAGSCKGSCAGSYTCTEASYGCGPIGSRRPAAGEGEGRCSESTRRPRGLENGRTGMDAACQYLGKRHASKATACISIGYVDCLLSLFGICWSSTSQECCEWVGTSQRHPGRGAWQSNGAWGLHAACLLASNTILSITPCGALSCASCGPKLHLIKKSNGPPSFSQWFTKTFLHPFI